MGSFLVCCKNGYLSGIHPFQSEIRENYLYKSLREYTLGFNLTDIIGYLTEGQYYINLWAAIFIYKILSPIKTKN
jgi:hypothetical protein